MIDVDFTEALPATLDRLMDRLGLEEAILTDLAESAQLKWRNIASKELSTSRQTYIEGIQDTEARPGERTITLVGWLANAIESGLDAYDMRRTLLYNPNAKNRKPIWSEAGRSGGRVQTGWYANVPFRHGTPGSTGLAGQPMGSQYGPQGSSLPGKLGGMMTAEAAKQFGKDVYKAAKRLKDRHIDKKGKERGPQRLREEHAGPKLSEHHTTSIYTGMRKVMKPYVKKSGKASVQPQYFTWRRISTENQTGWVHPGIEPHNFVDKVAKHVMEIAPGTVKTAIDSALKRRA